jgi:hypothetical protein
VIQEQCNTHSGKPLDISRTVQASQD